jgi:ATP synthase subunit 6
MFFSPLEQFEITVNNFKDLESFEILFSKIDLNLYEKFKCAFFLFLNDILINDFFFMLFRVLLVYVLIVFLFFNNKNFLIPSNFHFFFEFVYNFLAKTFREQVHYRGQKYFPFISTLFFYVVFINLFGMIPYEGAVASQGVLSLSLSFTVFLVLSLIGLVRQKTNFLYIFLPPKGIPTILIPLLIVIETVSYFSRAISLGVRLFANIMAGHSLLFIFSSFILSVNPVIGLAIFIIIILITCLEFVIAILQGYVFFVLTVIYFRDSIQVSH